MRWGAVRLVNDRVFATVLIIADRERYELGGFASADVVSGVRHNWHNLLS